MLTNVHKNILHNINLADIANEFVNRKDSRKHSDIFLRIIHNECKVKSTLGTFQIFLFPVIYIYNVEICSALPFIKQISISKWQSC